MKNKKKPESLIDTWADQAKEKKLTKGEHRRQILKPKNKSYVDRFEILEKEFASPIFDAEEDTQKEFDEKEEQDDKDDQEDHR